MTPAPSTTRSRTAVAGCLLAAAIAVSGCSGPEPAARRPSTDAPAPRTTSPEELCTVLVTYWAKVMLVNGRGAGLDWEQKGLSTVQRDILDDVVAAARAERERAGDSAASDVIDHQARQRCVADARKPGSPADNGGSDFR
ncbi:hypothetical protein [Streptomyces sp. KR80]|uniref:hypothetical protein n=1 Tax=Streptomyces sp. KR80 TaxID=3457426 RepID=UPI003FD30E26